MRSLNCVGKLIAFYDEFKVFLGNMNKYRDGAMDQATWTSFYDGKGVNVKLSRGSVEIAKSRITVSGFIQPGFVPDLIKDDELGFAHRMLVYFPKIKFPSFDTIKRLAEETDIPDVGQVWRVMADNVKHDAKHYVMTLSKEAELSYAEFFDELQAYNSVATGAVKSMRSKMKGVAIRVASVLQALTDAIQDTHGNQTVRNDAMVGGIKLTKVFMDIKECWIADKSSDSADSVDMKVLAKCPDGVVFTAADITKMKVKDGKTKGYMKADDVRKVLMSLVERNLMVKVAEKQFKKKGFEVETKENYEMDSSILKELSQLSLSANPADMRLNEKSIEY
jgi:hypothetical protein